MKKISIITTQAYSKNRLFDLGNPFLNANDSLLPFALLKQEFLKYGAEINTSDITSPMDAEVVIFNDLTSKMPNKLNGKKVLIIFESEVIQPKNWKRSNFEYFDIVFTWHDPLVDNKKFFKSNFSVDIRKTDYFYKKKARKIISISANKYSSHSKELYSARRNSISWFDKNAPSFFDFYGHGWDYNFNIDIQGKLQKLRLLRLFPRMKYSTYRGPVKDKIKTMSQYQFSLCYENAQMIEGYITEKILDSFISGTVPIYWGAPNISDFIPSNCFIDRRNFKTDQDLYYYLNDMKDSSIEEYIANIFNFLNSDSANQFSAHFWARNIASTVNKIL